MPKRPKPVCGKAGTANPGNQCCNCTALYTVISLTGIYTCIYSFLAVTHSPGHRQDLMASSPPDSLHHSYDLQVLYFGKYLFKL